MKKRTAEIILGITAAALLALPLALSQTSNSVQAEPTRQEFELALAKKDVEIVGLKHQIVELQGQLLNVQKQNLFFASRDVDADKMTADRVLKEKQEAVDKAKINPKPTAR